MTEKDKQIMDRFAMIIPKLSESDKDYLLGFGNGMAVNAEMKAKNETVLQANWKKLRGYYDKTICPSGAIK